MSDFSGFYNDPNDYIFILSLNESSNAIESPNEIAMQPVSNRAGNEIIHLIDNKGTVTHSIPPLTSEFKDELRIFAAFRERRRQIEKKHREEMQAVDDAYFPGISGISKIIQSYMYKKQPRCK